eukprot:578078-Rhodomonas_salina.2
MAAMTAERSMMLAKLGWYILYWVHEYEIWCTRISIRDWRRVPRDPGAETTPATYPGTAYGPKHAHAGSFSNSSIQYEIHQAGTDQIVAAFRSAPSTAPIRA